MKNSSSRPLTLDIASESLPQAVATRQLHAPAQLTSRRTPGTTITNPQDISCDRGDPEVRALEFQGNHAVSSGDLALRVTTTPSAILRRGLRVALGEKRCLNRNELPRDVLRLKAYYRERGFYSAQVDTVIQLAGRDAVRVLFRINEGQPTVLRSYRV